MGGVLMIDPKLVITFNEYERIRKNVTSTNPQLLIAIILAFESGLKIGEIRQLKKENITPQYIKIDRTIPLPMNWEKRYVDFLPIDIPQRTLQWGLSNICKKLRFLKFNFNSLRNGFIIWSFQRGFSNEYIKSVTGHSRKESVSALRKGISQKLRIKVLQKFNFKCRFCGRNPPNVKLDIDHIVPVALGGKNYVSNLQVLCKECNSGKKDTVIKLEDCC